MGMWLLMGLARWLPASPCQPPVSPQRTAGCYCPGLAVDLYERCCRTVNHPAHFCFPSAGL